MRNDIYNRNTQDPNYTQMQLEMDDTLEMFRQQIESCLFTPKTTVMGSLDFGAALDEYVWSFMTSTNDLNYAVVQQISKYCSLSTLYSYAVDSKFYAGSIRDIAVISITINDIDRFNVVIA